jgi:hypothetical protein
MSRDVVTVAEAYKEYEDGLFPDPSVKELEARFKNKWRKGNSETKFYSRRMPLYQMFDKLVVEGKYDRSQFLPRLEALRVKSGSMSKLCLNGKALLKRDTGSDLLIFLEQNIL